MKKHIYSTIFIFGILIQFLFSNALQSQVIKLINDTIDLAPCIPKTVNLLANDTIPPGDSVSLRSVGSNSGGYISVTINSGGNCTFVANSNGNLWGAKGEYIGGYVVHDYTLDTFFHDVQLVFHIRDYSYDSLYLNNINALFNACGNHFWGMSQPNARFEVPKFSGKTTIFSSSFWIGGLDQNSSLHLAAERYRQGPNNSNPWTKADYWAGPVMDSTAYSIYQDTLWNYIWNLKKSEIEYHKAHWSDAGYQPIHDILTWPGNGNVSFGQAAQLAPYYDRNNDGVYNPIDGDYPLIRGDQALFFIFNDDRNIHTESEGAKMKVEIHGMAYAFDLPQDSAFNNTIFFYYQIFNRSDNIYHNTWLGIFTDLDIGYAMDDYVGCDVERSMYYGYNGTPMDGSGQTQAYGANPPVQSVTILGGPYKDPDGIDNPRYDSTGHQLCNESVNGTNFGDSIVDNERLGMTKFVYFNNSGVPYYMRDPNYAPEYYNYLQGIWLDSTRMIYGGDGHASSGGYGPECNFMFPGESDTLNWGVGCVLPNGPVNWTETTAANVPGDRRGLGSCGPFTFNPGAMEEFDVAFSFARDYTGDNSLGKLWQVTDLIHNSFTTNTLPDGDSFNGIASTQKTTGFSLQLFPNPASSKLYIRFDRVLNEPVTMRIYNASGILVQAETFTSVDRTKTLNVDRLSSGLYLLYFETASQSVTKRLSIVN